MGLLYLFLFVGILIIFLVIGNNSKSNYSGRFDNQINPYQSRNPLTPTEAQLYERLVSALPEYIVLAQVQLSRFIEVDGTKVPGQYYKWFNPIAQQSVDFLICTKSFSIITAIELDDKSHQSLDARSRDEKKTKNLYAAKVPLIRWHAENIPSQSQIQIEVEKIVKSAYPQGQSLDFEPRIELFQRPNPNPALKFGAICVAIAIVGIFLVQLPSIISSGIKTVTPVAQNYGQELAKKIMEEQLAHQRQFDEQRRQQIAAQEEMKKRQIEAQQTAMRTQIEAQQAQEDEEKRRELAWEKFYTRSPECDRPENSVKCGNEYIRAKQRFEYFWANHKD